MILEFINRARADANAEAQRFKNTTDPDVQAAYAYFKVDLGQMVDQFEDLPQHLAPLSMNEKMLAAARLHSQDMLENRFQSHYSSTNPPFPNQPGDSPSNRLYRQGYNWQTYGENVYAYSKTPWHSHVGFDVDWGSGAYGMQVPPGHRKNIHHEPFREIGVGVVKGTTGGMGPLLVTHDFGATLYPLPFITGVVYFDLNGNQFYDLGEGLGGVTVTVAGQTASAVTSRSGGYSVPVESNGTYSVAFSAAEMDTKTLQAVVSDGQNAKLDFRPAYHAPVLSGPSNPVVGVEAAYAFSPVAAATGYQAVQARFSTAAWLEGAEDGTGGVEIVSSSGYEVIQSNVVDSGAHSFRLAHPTNDLQSVALLRWIVPSTASELRFRSRLGLATTTQVARVAISADGGMIWSNVYEQVGTGSANETTFRLRTAGLSAYAGRSVHIRFEYAYLGGSYYGPGASGAGWYFDDIEVTASRELVAAAETSLGLTGSFGFTPDATNGYRLMVRARNDERVFPWGPPLDVVAVTGSVALVRMFLPTISSGEPRQLTLQFEVVGTPPLLRLQQSESMGLPFTNLPGLSPQPLGGGRYQFQLDLPGDLRRFYRVRAED
ncbi:MAG: hypothetical protein EOM72_02120 [Opitutae bacterium]|nr:hypothetical protein [Opitutae bacterium]